LLGSTLLVIGLMLLLPRASGIGGRGKAGWGTWMFFGLSWIVFAVTEAIGGGHFDDWQIGAMLLLLPWAWLIRRDWSGFNWPLHSSAWRTAMIAWWTLLVVSAVTMYSPGILDRIKFTQGLVAHSHLAMAGFTTSFCAVLLSTLTHRSVGGRASVLVWNAAAFAMIAVLAAMGWREGQSAEWMIIPEHWREAGLVARAISGVFLLGSSLGWLFQFLRS
jgi:cytochrome c oxidase cbb3-type subunit 1